MASFNLEPFLLNFLFIIIPLYLFQILWVDKGYLYQKSLKLTTYIIILLASLSIVLCMSFTVIYSQGVIVDLRFIPLILGAFYGGYRVAIPLFLTIIIYRFFIGGVGMYINFIIISLLLIFIPLLKRRYHRLSLRDKTLGTFTTSVLSGIFIFILVKYILMSPVLIFDLTSINYIAIQGLSICLITYLIETTISNVNLREKLIHTEKLNVVSQLAASVAHEVRNPLTVSKGFLQLLKKSDLSSEQRNAYLDLSLAEMDRAEGVISDYLDMAKSNDTEVILSNMEEDVRYVMNVIKPYAIMYNVELNMSFDNALNIKYDPNQIRQCLINLAKNCIEAMDSGGILTIDLKSHSNNVIIEIEDTGVGMTKEELSHVGTPYYTTKDKGTGLGMMMVYNTIKELNGKIKIVSEKGKGTTFSIKIPVTKTNRNRVKKLTLNTRMSS